MAKSIDKAGTYNVDVTISQGCTIEFTPINGVTISPQSGGSQRYVFTVSDGANGTVVTKVNGNTCDDYSIVVNTGPGCTCNDLTISSVGAFPAAGDQNATLATNLSFGCLVNTGITIQQNNWITSTGVTNGSITGKVASYSDATIPRSVTITVSGKTATTATDTCTKTATVTQNPPSCTPSTCYSVSEATANVSATATRAEVTWRYTATTTNENCQTSTQTGSESKEVEFAAVTDCNDLTESGDFTWDGHTACGGSSDVKVRWTVYQEKPSWCDCGCSDLTVEAPSNIQAEGGSGVNLGRITPGCVENVKITSITYNGSESGWITATTSADSITSTFELTGNVADWSSGTGSQPRTATVTVTGKTVNNPNCSTSYAITQEAAGCTCQNGFGGATALTVTTPIVAGDEVEVWKVDKTCGQLYAITEGNCIASSGVTTRDGYYYITAKTKSDISSDCTFKVGYQLKVNGEICTNATGMSTEYTVEPAIKCECSDVAMTVDGTKTAWNKSIQWVSTDAGSGKKKTISIVNAGTDDCLGEVTSVETKDDDNAFSIEISSDNKTIEVYPKDPNTSTEDSKYAYFYVKYTLSNGSTCGGDQGIEITIEQLPSDDCTNCGLINKLNIPPVSTYPMKALTNFEFASGYTSDCGDFEIDTSLATAADFSMVKGPGNERHFFISLYHTTVGTASSLIIWFRYNDDYPAEEEDCKKTFDFIQQECNCMDVSALRWSYVGTDEKLPSTAVEGLRILEVDPDKYNYYCTTFDYDIDFHGGTSWISDLELDTSSTTWHYLTGNTIANSDKDERSADIIITSYVFVDKLQDWIECGFKRVTVTQLGRNCDCNEVDKTEKIDGNREKSSTLYGKTYYEPSCFAEGLEPNDYFTLENVEDEDNMFTDVKVSYYHKQGMYQARIAYTASTNPSSTEQRIGTITVKVNLANDDSCTFTCTITQEENPCSCESEYGFVTTTPLQPDHKAQRYEIADYYGGCDFSIELKDTSELPSWIDVNSVSHIDVGGNENLKYLYADFYANSGTTGTPPEGYPAITSDDDLYKTVERSKAIKIVLVGSDGECEGYKEVTIKQKGWSGSCPCNGTIYYSEEGCGTVVGDKHAYKYNGNTYQTLCYFNISNMEECNSIEVTSQHPSYFTSLKYEELSGGDYAYCMKGIIASTAGWDVDQPVDVHIRLKRKVGETNTEECAFLPFTILILKDND